MYKRLTILIDELRTRSVFRSAVAYLVVAWMLLQVADVTFDRLPIPESAMTVLIVLVILGFPVTIVLAWAYEITVRGIVRHEEVRGGAPRLAFLPFVLVLITVTAGVGYGLYYLSLGYRQPEPPSLAVLPFANLSAAEETEYFANGLTEELQSLIVRLNEIKVVALSSTYELKDRTMDIPSIARRLDVDYVLLGSVRRAEDRVRVTARLVNGEDSLELWSESYDKQLSDVFSIQESIAREVAAELHVVLPVSTEKRMANLGTTNVEAYDIYLRAADLLRQPMDEQTLLQAEDYLRQAIAIDPEFARPYAAWCEVHLIRYERARAVRNFEEAERACHRALTRDTSGADVHLALGSLYLYSGQYAESINEFVTALAANINSADAHIGLANVYTELNQPLEAEANLRRAIEIDASYWASFNQLGALLFSEGRFLEAAEFFREYARRSEDNATAYNNLGAAYYLAGDFAAAAAAWDRSLEIKPTSGAYANTGSMYFYLGQYETAAERYARAVGLAPMDYRLWGNLGDTYYYAADMRQVAEVTYRRAIQFAEQRLGINAADVDTTSDLAYFHAKVGETDRALELNEVALQNSPDDMYVNYNAALIFAHIGEREQALRSLERAVALDYQPELLAIDPGLSSLHEEERFKQLVSADEAQTALR